MALQKSGYYVNPITARKVIVGYGVYDCVDGIVSRHAEFMIDQSEPRGQEIALYLARLACRDMEIGIA